VVAGRQRTRAAIEANKRLVKEGAEPMSVRCVLEKADDATMLGIMISENEARANDDALTRAEKLQRFMAMGKSKEEAAIAFCKPMTQIAALLKVGDCSPKVRAALKAEKISLSVAAKLSELEREAQDEQLAEAITSGETSFKKVYKKVQKKTGGKHSDAPSKKEVKAIVEAFKGILSKDAHDALRWVLDGSEHGCMKALLTEIRKGLDDKAA
jgi:ParB-like chromosome segregation protein Spo0J